MAISDLQAESNLYLQWQNTKSALSNLSYACTFAAEQIASLQNMSEFSTYVSSEESQYLTDISPLITNFINSLPAQPT